MKITRLTAIVVFASCIMSVKAQIGNINAKDTLELYISELVSQDKITNSPLLVINGFAIDFATYKANNQPLLKADIKQIDYLSKNSNGATNIYGKRGKNGVLLITTKKSLGILQKNHLKTINDNILYIVEGQKTNYNKLKIMNPNDILSINVIKDKNMMKLYT